MDNAALVNVGVVISCLMVHVYIWIRNVHVMTRLLSSSSHFKTGYFSTGVTKAVVCVIMSVGWCI